MSSGVSAKPSFKEIQRQINTGADSAHCDNVTFVDDFPLFDCDSRELVGEQLEPITVRRRASSIEQTGSRQEKGACADGRDQLCFVLLPFDEPDHCLLVVPFFPSSG